MDNNNRAQAVPPAQPVSPAQAVPPTQPVTPASQSAQTPEGVNKMIIFLVVGVIVVILIVGGIYWMLSKQQASTQPGNQQTSNTAPSKPLTNLKDALDQELDAINVSASEGDFQSVDQDLKSL